jgi:similar to stage IV sporulation protein
VRKGDLLISGEYYDARGRKQYGAAQGVIKARVWYEGIGEGSLVRWEPVHTGRNHRQYAITIGNITIPVGRSYSLETHLKSEKEWQLSLGQAMVPLRFARIDYQEVEYIKVHVPSEEARKEALRMAWDNLKKQGVDEDQVREERQQVDFLTDAEGVRVTLQVEVLDDIGQFLTH